MPSMAFHILENRNQESHLSAMSCYPFSRHISCFSHSQFCASVASSVHIFFLPFFSIIIMNTLHLHNVFCGLQSPAIIAFLECLLHVGQCFRRRACIYPIRWKLPTSRWGSEKFNNLPEVTEIVSFRARIRTHDYMALNAMVFSPCYACCFPPTATLWCGRSSEHACFTGEEIGTEFVISPSEIAMFTWDVFGNVWTSLRDIKECKERIYF